jgi:hypothetical protein
MRSRRDPLWRKGEGGGGARRRKEEWIEGGKEGGRKGGRDGRTEGGRRKDDFSWVVGW